MPKRIADDDEKPRRRRGAKAIAVEAEAEHGLLMRMLLRSPKDMVAGALAVAAIGAIVANALFLQSGPHPSPMFGSVVTLPAPASVNPLPRPRPSEAIKSEAAPVEPKAVESKAADAKTSDAKVSELRASDLKVTDPLTNLVKATSSAPAPTSVAPVSTSAIPRPPAPIPVASRTEGNLGPGGSRRVAAVQRALTEYGYGQLKPTGAIGPDTQAAIAKFERDRRIPATGQMTERMVRELSAMIGHAID
ncbi:MAG: peptidoglycan-binding domain-containing protein [Bradyrhizobium sp.]